MTGPIYQAVMRSSEPAVLVDSGPGVHPRGKKRTHVVAVVFKKDGKVWVVEWHIRDRSEAQVYELAYRVMSSRTNAIGNYWQFEFRTYQEVTHFLMFMAQNYN